jgi:hypothetical protein
LFLYIFESVKPKEKNIQHTKDTLVSNLLIGEITESEFLSATKSLNKELCRINPNFKNELKMRTQKAKEHLKRKAEKAAVERKILEMNKKMLVILFYI